MVSEDMICRVREVTSGDTMPRILKFDSSKLGREGDIAVSLWSIKVILIDSDRSKR